MVACSLPAASLGHRLELLYLSRSLWAGSSARWLMGRRAPRGAGSRLRTAWPCRSDRRWRCSQRAAGDALGRLPGPSCRRPMSCCSARAQPPVGHWPLDWLRACRSRAAPSRARARPWCLWGSPATAEASPPRRRRAASGAGRAGGGRVGGGALTALRTGVSAGDLAWARSLALAGVGSGAGSVGREAAFWPAPGVGGAIQHGVSRNGSPRSSPSPRSLPAAAVWPDLR